MAGLSRTESYSWNWVLLGRPGCEWRDISFPNPVWTNAMLGWARLSDRPRQQTGLRPSSHTAPALLEAGAAEPHPLSTCRRGCQGGVGVMTLRPGQTGDDLQQFWETVADGEAGDRKQTAAFHGDFPHDVSIISTNEKDRLIIRHGRFVQ